MDANTIEILKNVDPNSVELDVSNLGIIGIINFRKFPKLEKINCSQNQITKILGLTKKLKILNCSNNSITQLISNDFMKLNREELDIDWTLNPIEFLFYIFDKNKYNHYPNTLKIINFSDDFNDHIDNLPTSLHEIFFSPMSKFNYQVDNLPEGIEIITFGHLFNHPMDNLPSSIKQIIFHSSCYYNYDYIKYNHSINNLPNSLEKLILSDKFNLPIQNYPKKIKYLEFGNIFNQLVDNLPDSLEKIVFGCAFNCSIDKLSDSIKEIYFAKPSQNSDKYDFNQTINHLPNSLEKIIFCTNFNSPILNYPQNLQYIKFGDKFNQPISNLPASLKVLILGNEFCQDINKFPINLTHLTIKSNIKILELPQQISSLYVSNINIENCNLSGIKKLKLNKSVLVSETKLQNMKNLEELIIYSESYYKNIADFLPNTIKKLTIVDKGNFRLKATKLLQNLELFVINRKEYSNKKLQKMQKNGFIIFN